ncbi:MAG: GerMN domain-containing protein [Clostridiales Family XIII bacterium]|jgi:hypothetical protein|nr:GerMN domain-containing protein [Clostridiales Family XIII bacterium]
MNMQHTKKPVIKILSLMIAVILLATIVVGCNSDKENVKTKDNEKKTSTSEETKQADKPKSAENVEPTEPADTADAADTKASSVDLTVYFSNENADGLNTEVVKITELSPINIIHALIDKGVLSPDVLINSFSDTSYEGSKAITIDLNSSFEAYIKTMGSAGESIVLKSIVNTFLVAYDCEYILITVDGNDLSTGHDLYDYYMTFSE